MNSPDYDIREVVAAAAVRYAAPSAVLARLAAGRPLHAALRRSGEIVYVEAAVAARSVQHGFEASARLDAAATAGPEAFAEALLRGAACEACATPVGAERGFHHGRALHLDRGRCDAVMAHEAGYRG